MLRRRDEEQLLAHHRDADEARVVNRKRHEAEVSRAGAKLTENPRCRARPHLDFDAGVRPPEHLQKRRKHVQADGHSADDSKRAGERLLALENARPRLVDVFEQAITQAEQRRSGRRNLDLSPDPQKELLAQFLLEQEYLPAHGGLRQVEVLAGTRERAGGRNGLENLELPEIHRPLHSVTVFRSPQFTDTRECPHGSIASCTWLHHPKAFAGPRIMLLMMTCTPGGPPRSVHSKTRSAQSQIHVRHFLISLANDGVDAIDPPPIRTSTRERASSDSGYDALLS